MWKYPLLIVSILLTAVLTTALVAPHFVDWASYRPQIEKQLSDLAGRPVDIGQSIDVRLLPAPELKLQNIVVKGPSGSKDDVFRARALNMRLALAPLLRGKLQLTAIELIEPVVKAEIRTDGSSNLGFLRKRVTARLPGFDSVALDHVTVQSGQLIFVDRRHGGEVRWHNVTGKLSAPSLVGPFRLTSGFTSRGVRRQLKLTTGRLRENVLGLTDLRLRIAVKPDEDPASAGEALAYDVDGQITDLYGAAEFNGKFMLSSGQAKGMAQGRLTANLEAQLKADWHKAAFEKISLKLPQGKHSTNFTGRADVNWGETIQVNATLKTNRLGLQVPGKDGQAAVDLSPKRIEHAFTQFLNSIKRQNITGKATLDAGLIMLWGEQIQDAGLTLQFARDAIYVRRAIATFPGHAQMSITGALRPRQPNRLFIGTAAFRAVDARKFVRWIAPGKPAEFAAILPRRIGNVAVSGKAFLEDGLFSLRDGTVKIGPIESAVSLKLRTGARTQFGIGIAAAKIDVDELLDLEKDTKPKRPKAEAQTTLNMLKSAIGSFDAAANIQLEQIVYNGFKFVDLQSSLRLIKGDLEVERFQVRDELGGRLNAEGDVKSLAENPQIKLTADIKAAQAGAFGGLLATETRGGLSRLVAVGNIERFAPLDLDFAFASHAVGSGPNQEITTSMSGEVAGSALSLDAVFKGLPRAPEKGRVDVRAELSNPSSLALMRQIGFTLRNARARKKGLVRAAVSGPLSGSLDLALGWQVHGVQGTIKGSGEIRDSGPSLEAEVEIAGKDARDFLTGIGVKLPAEPKQVLPIKLKGVAAGRGGEYVFSGFKGAVGPLKLGFNGTANFTAPRTILRTNLRLSEARLPWIFDQGVLSNADLSNPGENLRRAAIAAPKTEKIVTGSIKPSSSTGPQVANDWPSQLLNLDLFSALDMDITAAVDNFWVSDGTAIKDTQIEASLREGDLKIKKFNGQLLSGAFDLSGDIATGSGRLTADLDYALKAGRLERLLIDRDGDVLATGRLELAGKLTGQGRSALGLISSLKGKGSLQLRDGILRGFNPETFERALQNVQNETELDGFIKGILIDGEMAFSAIDSEFSILNGLIRMADMTLKGKGASGRIISFVDVPSYRIDSEWRLQLAAYPKAPPVTVIFSGPLNAPVRAFDVRGLRRHLVVEKLKRNMQKLEELKEKEARRLEEMKKREARWAKEMKEREARRAAEEAAEKAALKAVKPEPTAVTARPPSGMKKSPPPDPAARLPVTTLPPTVVKLPKAVPPRDAVPAKAAVPSVPKTQKPLSAARPVPAVLPVKEQAAAGSDISPKPDVNIGPVVRPRQRPETQNLREQQGPSRSGPITFDGTTDF